MDMVRGVIKRILEFPGIGLLALLPVMGLIGVGIGESIVRFTPLGAMPRSTPMVLSATATPLPSMPPAPIATAAPTPLPTPTPMAHPVSAAAPAEPSEIASTTVCPSQADAGQSAAALVCLSAWARMFHGLRAIAADSALMSAAEAKAADMRTCGYSHTACGRSFEYWIHDRGFTSGCVAENIAAGQRTPVEVFRSWMKSPGHRANILNSNYSAIGIGETPGPAGPLWVMELGGC